MTNTTTTQTAVKHTWNNMRTKTLILLGIVLVVLLVVLAVGLTMNPDLYSSHLTGKLQKPSGAHWFGTDYLGHDMFHRTIRGLALSILIGLGASIISGIIAIVLGTISAVCSGWIDKVVLWAVDLVLSIPHMVLLLLISFALGGGVQGVIVAVALSHWPTLTRVIRAEVLRIKTSQYVAQSRSFGKNGVWIAFHHVIPHILPQAIVGIIMLFPHAILHESALTFLGFGLPLDSPAIGAILTDAMKFIATGQWWLAFFPGLLLVIIVLLMFTLGDNIKHLLSPQTAQE